MSKNLFLLIVDEDNIESAYRKSLKGDNKYTREAILFSRNETYNLRALRQSLIDETYRFSGYIRFTVYEPKERLIDAPGFKDKTVQLAVNNVLKEIYQPCFIYDSYASLDGKGTHRCIDRIQHFMRKAKWEYGEGAYIVKVDVRKFFYSIDRAILKGILSWKVKCEKTLRLLYHIIDSADAIDPLGLPLGNTLSQLWANTYLDKLDQYCKRRLRLKYYVRYMDDVIIIVKDRETARGVVAQVTAFLRDRLRLDVNKDKTKIFPIRQGVNAIGFKIHATHRLLRNDSKKKIKRKAKKMRRLIAEGRMTVEKAEQILNSWKGHAGHGNSYNFVRRLIERNDYIYLDQKGRLKVDTTKINAGGG